MSIFKAVLNYGQGRFGLSTAARIEYEKRTSTRERKFSRGEYLNPSFRSDTILIDIIEEMGLAANGDFARLVIIKLDSEYKDCFKIYPYPGGESIVINKEKWLTDGIRSVTEDPALTDTEKLKQISALYIEYDYCKDEE
jgi:hypothetical protein